MLFIFNKYVLCSAVFFLSSVGLFTAQKIKLNSREKKKEKHFYLIQTFFPCYSTKGGKINTVF